MVLSDEQCAARSAAGFALLERRRQKRVIETAERFAACRDLAACFRRQNIPRRFVGRYERRAQHWWYAFAFALREELDRSIFADEVDYVLFTMVGSGTP